MLQKIKKLTVLTALTLLFSLAPSLPALVAGDTSVTAGRAIAASDPCHPENDTLGKTKMKVGGHQLTGPQRTNCQACNKQYSEAQAVKCLQTNPIVRDLNTVINVLAGLVGVVCVAMIVVGGIQYSLARNNPQATAGARTRILNAVIAMVAFMFIWALLQYLIPGGVFKS